MSESIRLPMEICAKLLDSYYSILDTRRTLNNVRKELWDGKVIEAHEIAREQQEKLTDIIVPEMKEVLKHLNDNGYWFKTDETKSS